MYNTQIPTNSIPVTQNGASQIDSNHVNAMHQNNQRHMNVNNIDPCRKPTTMTGNTIAGATKITAIDQHTNPFVFKVHISILRKIAVSADNLLSLFFYFQI